MIYYLEKWRMFEETVIFHLHTFVLLLPTKTVPLEQASLSQPDFDPFF